VFHQRAGFWTLEAGGLAGRAVLSTELNHRCVAEPTFVRGDRGLEGFPNLFVVRVGRGEAPKWMAQNWLMRTQKAGQR
jgi:hypothetical protein